MRNKTFKQWMWRGLLAGIAGIVILGTGVPSAEANRGHGNRHENRRDRLENRWDRHEGRWDRFENRRQYRHRQHYRSWQRRQACDRNSVVRTVYPRRWGIWYSAVPKMRYDSRPFYFHAGLGVYFGGFALEMELGDRAPRGYVYVHPPTGKRFRTVKQFRRWCRRHPRQDTILTLRPRY